MFRCKNYGIGCIINFQSAKTLEKHELKCVTPKEAKSNPKIIQLCFKQSDHPLEATLKRGWIDKYPVNNNFIVYDIESILSPVNEDISEKQTVKDHHLLLSIAANAFINGEHQSECWVVEDSSENARLAIVKKFVMFCQRTLDHMVIDSNLFVLLEQLKIELSETNWFNSAKRRCLSSQIYEINNYLSLPIFGYNSAKYDLQILMKYLVDVVCNEKVIIIVFIC